MSRAVYILLVVCVWQTRSSSSANSRSDEDELLEGFIPTTEWQEIAPGQAIPPGLHVKMDLEKGGRWAKLIDENEPQQKSVMAIQEPNPNGGSKSNKLDRMKIKELKEALKNMKEDKKKQDNAVVKEKFRSMDEIKSAFDQLQLQQETDFEVMKRLLDKYRLPETQVEEKVQILADLEHYVHQVDNAVDFAKLDGLSIMVKALNSSEPRIQTEAAHVIGSSVQSNPAVQVKAMEAGVLPLLVRIISDRKESEGLRKKALYAVSCLIRHFPAAQYLFKNAGGFSALSNCLNEHGTEKLRFKAISLINDLAVERRDLLASHRPNEYDKERERQYQLFTFSDEMEQMKFCSSILKFLNTEEHDQRETLLNVMKNLHDVCYRTKNYVVETKTFLEGFISDYGALSKGEELTGDFDSFFHTMLVESMDLLHFISNYQPGIVHKEL